MKKQKQGQEKDKKVLADYKKVGTTFVPPMVHRVGPWEFTSWSSQTLPELIWWDVLSRIPGDTKTKQQLRKRMKGSISYTLPHRARLPAEIQLLERYSHGTSFTEHKDRVSPWGSIAD